MAWSLGMPLPGETHRVTVSGTGEFYACRPGQSLLAALAALGRKCIPSGCHGGGCGICLVRVIEGRVETGPMSCAHVPPERRAEGFALACRTYPRSPVTIEVAGRLRSRAAESDETENRRKSWA